MCEGEVKENQIGEKLGGHNPDDDISKQQVRQLDQWNQAESKGEVRRGLVVDQGDVGREDPSVEGVHPKDSAER